MPTARLSFCDRPQPDARPTRAWVSAKRASVLASNTSQASASSKPPVTAAPLMAPITGFFRCSITPTGSPRELTVVLPMSVPPAPSSFRSRPAQNARPAPVRMITRTAGSSPHRCKVLASVSSSSRDSAFIACGRFNVTTATPSPDTSCSTTGSLMSIFQLRISTRLRPLRLA
jgi:hypothetical protein